MAALSGGVTIKATAAGLADLLLAQARGGQVEARGEEMGEGRREDKRGLELLFKKGAKII